MALIILLYHAIDDSGSFLSVPPRAFRQQMAAVAASGRRVLTIAEAGQALARGQSLADAVCLTFDDGYHSVAETAWPILRDFGFSATTYFVTGAMGGTANWLPRLFPEMFGASDARARQAFEARIGTATIRDPGLAADPVGAFRKSATLPVMTWDTARDLTAEGMDPGGHSATHPFLSRLAPPALTAEIADARGALEDRLGARVASFAYPFGDFNAETVAAVQGAGYAIAVTSRAGVVANPRRSLDWNRIGIWPNVTARKMAFYLSRPYGVMKWLRP